MARKTGNFAGGEALREWACQSSTDKGKRAVWNTKPRWWLTTIGPKFLKVRSAKGEEEEEEEEEGEEGGSCCCKTRSIDGREDTGILRVWVASKGRTPVF